ncbi:2-oxoglutarate-dependent dioxygenase DAO-like [Malania oleifera]|uniref:2-oxoglutarate-dependent dioxygenase DAO-like n=1 Tax=Malania oleifera TaxID=397392 RepID=UPI0025AE93B7|nr:2-oxoglutarate-dependent dioxygenase DAO-like [Malania oleifera]
MAGVIPVIDLEDFPGQSQKLVAACEEWGCFRVVNHKIPAILTSEMRSVAADLLGLPMEIKQRSGNIIDGRGYLPPNDINPLHEALGIYDICLPQGVHEFCDLLDASPRHSEIMTKYLEATNELAKDIARKMAKSMGLALPVCDGLFEGWCSQFRMNQYNFSPANIGSCGVPMHTDPGFITILLEDDNNGGLEVMDKSGKFIPADPISGTLLVNLGDVAKVWSNGRFQNVKHQVQCKVPTKRVSIVTFLLAPKDAVVEAPSEFVDTKHPRLYVPFTYQDFRQIRLSRNLHCGEVLDLVRAK